MKRWAVLAGLLLLLGVALAVYFADTPAAREIRGLLLPGPFDTVVIDAGHGGRDPGALAGGLVEKNLALDLALRLRRKLEARGVEVVMTRDDDTFLTLDERTRIAARAGNAIMVSLHFNKAPSAEARGVETFFHDPDYPEEFPALSEAADLPPRAATESELLASAIHAEVSAATGALDRGIKNHPYFVVRNAKVPSVLVEGGFMSHPFEARMIANGGYRDILARAIADGIMEYRSLQAPESSARLAHKSSSASP